MSRSRMVKKLEQWFDPRVVREICDLTLAFSIEYRPIRTAGNEMDQTIADLDLLECAFWTYARTVTEADA
jgi:hypothetical protein